MKALLGYVVLRGNGPVHFMFSRVAPLWHDRPWCGCPSSSWHRRQRLHWTQFSHSTTAAASRIPSSRCWVGGSPRPLLPTSLHQKGFWSQSHQDLLDDLDLCCLLLCLLIWFVVSYCFLFIYKNITPLHISCSIPRLLTVLGELGVTCSSACGQCHTPTHTPQLCFINGVGVWFHEHESSLYTSKPTSTGECDEWRLFADGRFFTGGVAPAIFQPFSPSSLLWGFRRTLCHWRLDLWFKVG